MGTLKKVVRSSTTVTLELQLSSCRTYFCLISRATLHCLKCIVSCCQLVRDWRGTLSLAAPPNRQSSFHGVYQVSRLQAFLLIYFINCGFHYWLNVFFLFPARSMFIQVQDTPNPMTLKFLPGVPVLGESNRTIDFTSVSEAKKSPLALYVFFRTQWPVSFIKMSNMSSKFFPCSSYFFTSLVSYGQQKRINMIPNVLIFDEAIANPIDIFVLTMDRCVNKIISITKHEAIMTLSWLYRTVKSLYHMRFDQRNNLKKYLSLP